MELSRYKYLCFILSNHVIENDFCSSVKEVSALHRVYRLSDKWQLLYRTILSTHVFLYCCNITFVGLCELLVCGFISMLVYLTHIISMAVLLTATNWRWSSFLASTQSVHVDYLAHQQASVSDCHWIDGCCELRCRWNVSSSSSSCGHSTNVSSTILTHILGHSAADSNALSLNASMNWILYWLQQVIHQRDREDPAAVRRGDMSNRIAVHAWDQQHRVDSWENASVLKQEPGYWKRGVIEAIEIQRHAENTNLDCGSTLNPIWTLFLWPVWSTCPPPNHFSVCIILPYHITSCLPIYPCHYFVLLFLLVYLCYQSLQLIEVHGQKRSVTTCYYKLNKTLQVIKKSLPVMKKTLQVKA